MYSRQSHPLTDLDEEFLRSAANLCAVVFDRAELMQFKERVKQSCAKAARASIADPPARDLSQTHRVRA